MCSSTQIFPIQFYGSVLLCLYISSRISGSSMLEVEVSCANARSS